MYIKVLPKLLCALSIRMLKDGRVSTGNSVSESVAYQRSRSPLAAATPPTWLLLLALVMVQGICPKIQTNRYGEQVGFGLYGVVLEKFSMSMDPLIFSFYRDICAVVVLLGCALVFEGKVHIPKSSEIPVFVILGFAGVYGNQLLFTLGVRFVGSNVTSIINQLQPIWGAVLPIIFGIESFPPLTKFISWIKLTGVLTACCGAIEMIASTGSVAVHHHDNSVTYSMLGCMLVLAGTFTSAFGLMFQKKMLFYNASHWMSLPITATFWSYMFGAIFMGMSSLYYLQRPEKYSISSEVLYALLYAVLISSVTCYVLISWANRYLPVTIVTLSWTLQVLVTAVAAYVVLGDQLKFVQYIGGVLIILGLVMVVWSNHKLTHSNGQNLYRRNHLTHSPILRT